MKKTLTTLVIALSGMVGTAFAQQDPQFTQFQHCKLAYNPGVAGTNQSMCFGMLGRQQWVSFPGAPRTGLVSFDMPLKAISSGVGLVVMSDQLGFTNNLHARASYSFHRNLGADGAGILGLGIDAGIYQTKINGTWVTPSGNLNDPSIPNNTINTTPLNKMTPDFSFGAYYTIPNKMYVGISSLHLAAQEFTGENNNTLNFKVARHYYLIAGYTFHLAEGDLHDLTPNIKVKSDAASTQLDVNLTYMYNKMVWAGLTYRVQDAIAPTIGYMAPFGLKVGYSYDVTTSKIKGYSSGTHEIMLGYCFKSDKPPVKIEHRNVRFMED